MGVFDSKYRYRGKLTCQGDDHIAFNNGGLPSSAFSYKQLKLKLRVFLKGYCYYGDSLSQKDDLNIFSND